jgi:hypothetical protein
VKMRMIVIGAVGSLIGAVGVLLVGYLAVRVIASVRQGYSRRRWTGISAEAHRLATFLRLVRSANEKSCRMGERASSTSPIRMAPS